MGYVMVYTTFQNYIHKYEISRILYWMALNWIKSNMYIHSVLKEKIEEKQFLSTSLGRGVLSMQSCFG